MKRGQQTMSITRHELFLLSQLRVGVATHSDGELRRPEVLHQLAAPHVLTLRYVRQLLNILLFKSSNIFFNPDLA